MTSDVTDVLSMVVVLSEMCTVTFSRVSGTFFVVVRHVMATCREETAFLLLSSDVSTSDWVSLCLPDGPLPITLNVMGINIRRFPTSISIFEFRTPTYSPNLLPSSFLISIFLLIMSIGTKPVATRKIKYKPKYHPGPNQAEIN
ncbi:hypothetical protein Hanom_Chr07g00617361 [Helianthus anomalus]